MPVPVSWYLILSALLFVVGAVGVLVQRNVILMLMGIEIMLNAGNLAFLALARSLGKPDGQAVVLFVITAAAAEAVVGLAIIVLVFRRRKAVRTDDLKELRG